jgi:hypothetical protein
MTKTMERAELYTPGQIREMIRKAVRLDREFLVTVMRGLPDIDEEDKKLLIANPRYVAKYQSQLGSDWPIVHLEKEPLLQVFRCHPSPENPIGVHEHVADKPFPFNPDELKLGYIKSQQNHVTGTVLLDLLNQRFGWKNLFNANLLDYFLKYPQQVPPDWLELLHDGNGTDVNEIQMIWFFGTTYVFKGEFYVRGMYYSINGISETSKPLDATFDTFDHAAIRSRKKAQKRAK